MTDTDEGTQQSQMVFCFLKEMSILIILTIILPIFTFCTILEVIGWKYVTALLLLSFLLHGNKMCPFYCCFVCTLDVVFQITISHHLPSGDVEVKHFTFCKFRHIHFYTQQKALDFQIVYFDSSCVKNCENGSIF